MGDRLHTVSDRFDAVIRHRYTPGMAFLGAGGATGLALTPPTLPPLTEFETHLVIATLFLILYMVFFSSIWIRAMILPRPKRRPPRTGLLSVAGVAVLVAPPTYAVPVPNTATIGLGVGVVGAAVLAHELVGWLRHQ